MTYQQIHIFRQFLTSPKRQRIHLCSIPAWEESVYIANEISFSDERSLSIFVHIPSLAKRDVVARAICMITPSDHASIPPINGQAAISRSNSFSLCEQRFVIITLPDFLYLPRSIAQLRVSSLSQFRFPFPPLYIVCIISDLFRSSIRACRGAVKEMT